MPISGRRALPSYGHWAYWRAFNVLSDGGRWENRSQCRNQSSAPWLGLHIQQLSKSSVSEENRMPASAPHPSLPALPWWKEWKRSRASRAVELVDSECLIVNSYDQLYTAAKSFCRWNCSQLITSRDLIAAQYAPSTTSGSIPSRTAASHTEHFSRPQITSTERQRTSSLVIRTLDSSTTISQQSEDKAVCLPWMQGRCLYVDDSRAIRRCWICTAERTVAIQAYVRSHS